MRRVWMVMALAFSVGLVAPGGGLTGLVGAGDARAEDEGTGGAVEVELNKLEPAEQGCRVYLLLSNGTDEAFRSLELDLVMFDDDGIVARRLALETAPLDAGRTQIKVFDLAELGCDAIGRVLLNGVLACEGPSGPREGCLEAIRVSSKADVPLIR